MDDEVHGVGDHQVGDLDIEAFRCHGHVHLEPGEDPEAGVGVDSAHRPVVALRHRQHHRERLSAPNLSDDDTVGLHAKAGPNESMHRELADAFEVRISRFEVDAVGVQVSEVFEPDLQRIFDGDNSFVGWHLVEEATQQCRLSGPGTTGNDHVEPGCNHRLEHVV